MTNERPQRSRIGHWCLVIGLCVLLAACGGGNNGPELATLGGDRNKVEIGPVRPTDEFGTPPMPEHGRLAAMLPREALVKKSVVFSDWDQLSGQPSGDGKGASLPTVQAMYDSVGYKVVVDDPKAPKGKSRAEIDHPQQATLILVHAPQASAASAVADRLRRHFADKGFSSEEALHVADGTEGGGRIERFLRIDTGAEADSVYVAYLQVIGNLVVYAVETEKPPPIKAADGTQAKRVLSGPSGARLGAQLVLLVLTRAVQ